MVQMIMMRMMMKMHDNIDDDEVWKLAVAEQASKLSHARPRLADHFGLASICRLGNPV